MTTLCLTKPDDWHVHFRAGKPLKDTVAATATHFARALAMPNLTRPLTSYQRLKAYQQDVQAVSPEGFQAYFTFYLTDNFDTDEFDKAQADNLMLGAKLYPQGATTHSDSGVGDLKKLYPVFDAMQERELTLQVHGEAIKGDIFARERQFIEESLIPLTKNFPSLRIVLEHISTQAACDFVIGSTDNVAATITVHHLLYNRNHLLAGGIKPHYYCLPILKSETQQLALQRAALSGSPKFFLGTDSAPHAIEDKQSACGCAGIFSAPYAMALYVQFFDEHDGLAKLEGFASQFGADFYGLPQNKEKITLEKKPQLIPERLAFGDQQVMPLAYGQTIPWSVTIPPTEN